jgi:ribosomal protein S18 acetylase RimI-like enzyme
MDGTPDPGAAEQRMSRTLTIRPASADDLPAVKALVDGCRRELGFVPLPALRRALDRGWLNVAECGGAVVGMVEWWARRDGVTVLHTIAVAPSARGLGIGRRLLASLVGRARAAGAGSIRLKCPEELPANEFYRRAGFALTGREPGKQRALNCWTLVLASTAPP